MPPTECCELTFDAGTLLVRGPQRLLNPALHYLKFDPRVNAHRAQACHYSDIMRILYAAHIPVNDHVRDYQDLPLTLNTPHKPMKHQAAALEAWRAAKGRGVVVMPTGSGKTFFAFLAMRMTARSTLVLVPTIDLLQQWAGQLEKAFGQKVGMLGGGSHEILPITVSTYDSAVLNMEFIGNKFGLLICDECHHLPGPTNRTAAVMCIAPYRLGLTATPEHNDDGEAERVMEEVLGKIVYYVHIDQLEGTVLAPYVTRRIPVELDPDEEKEYRESHAKYVGFVRACGLDFSEPGSWMRFIALCMRRKGGREVFDAYQRQRAIARCGRGKFKLLWNIIRRNPGARIIIFTADNDTAYRIGETLCLPVLTHKTKAAERKDFLESFRSGAYPVLVTSKVLNEGVDVPEANIGIVVSGSGSTREHVQRLGRILRRSNAGKQAVLYELVSAGTSEMSVSERRRQHRAYNPWLRHEAGEEPPSC